MWGESRSISDGLSLDVPRLQRDIDFGEKRRLTGLEFLLRERLAERTRFTFLSHRAIKAMSNIREARLAE